MEDFTHIPMSIKRMATKAANLFASVFIIVTICVMLVDAAILAKDLAISVYDRTKNHSYTPAAEEVLITAVE